jgi:hypothetical protein
VQVDITVSCTDYGVVEDFHLCLNHIISQYLRQHMELPSSISAIAAIASD